MPVDELALSFEDGHLLLPQWVSAGWLPVEATPHFAAVDAALSDMSGAEHAHLWTVEALRDAPEWARVRELAARALHFLSRPLIGKVAPIAAKANVSRVTDSTTDFVHHVRMSDVSDEELEAMDARATAALPGPWLASWEGRDHTSGDSFIGTGRDEDRGPDIYVSTDVGPAGQSDLDFIAHARQDIPRLIDEVRRLRRLVAGAT